MRYEQAILSTDDSCEPTSGCVNVDGLLCSVRIRNDTLVSGLDVSVHGIDDSLIETGSEVMAIAAMQRITRKISKHNWQSVYIIWHNACCVVGFVEYFECV